MNELLIGYPRVSTYEQDLTAQRNALVKLGVDDRNIYTDHGLTGTNGNAPGSASHSPRAGRATPSSSRSWIVWPNPLRDASDIVDDRERGQAQHWRLGS